MKRSKKRNLILVLLGLESFVLISVVIFRALIFLGVHAPLDISFANNMLYAAFCLGILTYLALLSAATIKKVRNPILPNSIGGFVGKIVKFLVKLPFTYIEILLADPPPRAK